MLSPFNSGLPMRLSGLCDSDRFHSGKGFASHLSVMMFRDKMPHFAGRDAPEQRMDYNPHSLSAVRIQRQFFAFVSIDIINPGVCFYAGLAG